MRGSRLHQLPLAKRRVLGAGLAAAGMAYLALLVTTYLQLTPASSLFPDLYEIDRLLFSRAKPVSRIERLLEVSGGEMSGGGTMRPAFTDQSTGWEELTKAMTAEELADVSAEREGERLALLDWVRSGASRDAYDQDDYLLANPSAVNRITANYLLPEGSTPPSRVRIRSLISDRCATCHSENGRHDTARFIPLDTYASIQPRTLPEEIRSPNKVWLFGSLLALPLLGLLTSAIFWRSTYTRRVRTYLIAIPSIALGMALACWAFGQSGGYSTHLLLGLAAVAAIGILIQMAASLSELFTHSPT